mmetsp:Transcript_37945/g.80673  ORF Transcript_37945/g.80673 Transcript_37945/m.80673 type:complete len:235 (-) Transcript_37945:112-816(-)
MGGHGVAVVLALLAAACRIVGAEPVRVENGVMKLEEQNFESALSKFPVLLVHFYAPWCGGCNGMHDQFAKAAREFRKQELPAPRLAKVDVTVETKMEKLWNVKVNTEPIVVVYTNGKESGRYKGKPRKQEIIDYVASIQAGPTLGSAMRKYNNLFYTYEETVKAMLPKKYWKLATRLMPLVLVGAVLCVLAFVAFCRCCCRACFRCCCGKRKAKKEVAKNGDAAESKDESKKED